MRAPHSPKCPSSWFGLADGVLLCQIACEFVAASRKLNDRGFIPIDA